MKKVLFIGDGFTPTGFSTVLHNIIKSLPVDDYEIHHIAINYFGDPHNFPWKMYPASTGGDIWGFGRLAKFESLEPNIVFILNDPWVVSKYLPIIKSWAKKPKIVVYFPVDSMNLSKRWFSDYDIVDKTCVYTKFGAQEVIDVADELINNEKLVIIPHGVDTNSFYKTNTDKEISKKILFRDNREFTDSFIVLNANRNQPRKRVDLTIQGFSLFAKDKPSNVKLYLHMGTRDAGFDIIELCVRYKIEDRLIITNTKDKIQSVPVEHLNLIYNACDVGLSTTLGEGWGLTNVEHAATGAIQIVPAHSACKEIFDGCGKLIDVNQWLTNNDTLTTSGLVHPKDVANALQEVYEDKPLRLELAEKGYKKFSSSEYTWKYITENYWLPVFNELCEVG